MKTLKIIVFLFGLGASTSCSQKTAVIPNDTQVVGRWNLVRITYGFSQLSRTAAEAGISEILDYKSDGTYQRLTTDLNGQHEENGKFSTGPNPTKTAEKQAILYPDDKTTQPYSFQDGHLFLYQRGSQNATIADGSTYEYQR